MYLPLKEQRKFFDKNPDFMSSYPIARDRMEVLDDSMYRGIRRKIKRYESEKEMALLKCPECGKEAKGRNGGRPSKQNEKGDVVKALADIGMKIVDIVKETGLSRSTVNRILRESK